MKSDDTKNLSYRLDTDTYESTKYQIVPATDRWDSVSEFTRDSIQKQTKQLISLASGGRQANKVIRRLSDIDGIDEKASETAPKPRIENEALDKSLSVSLPVEDFGLVNNLVDQSYLDRSNVPGYCIFRQISRGDTPRDVLDDWYEKKIHLKWTELENSLLEPQLRLHYVLAKRFRVHEMTSHFIQQDLSGFEGFAEVYHDELYGTDHYDNLQEIFGSRTFNDVENTIEEHTDYKFEESNTASADSNFLEGYLD